MWAAQFYTLHAPAPVRQLRRPRHDGLRAARRPSARSSACPDQHGHRHRRRRQLPDEHPGAGHRRERRSCPSRSCILNNGYLGMVRQWQELFCDKRYSFTCLMRATAGVSAGATARARAPRAARLQAARRGLRRGRGDRDGEGRDRAGPARGDRLRPAGGHRLPTSAEENVYPMVPAGQRSPR